MNIEGAGTYTRELAGDSGRYTSWSSLWYNIPINMYYDINFILEQKYYWNY